MGGRRVLWIGLAVFVIAGGAGGWWWVTQEGASPVASVQAPRPVVLDEVQGLATAGATDEATERLESWLATNPDTPEFAGQGWYQLGQLYQQQHQLAPARRAYQSVIQRYPGSTVIQLAQQALESINMELLFSPIVTDQDTVHVVEPGDTLSQIAKQYDTTVELLRRANQLEGDLIRPGLELKISQRPFNILVDKSRNALFLKASDEIMKTYGVATGLQNSTPTGEFAIINKLVDPVWYKAGAIVPPQSEDNILGSRWLGLSKQGYGIHGTTQPDAIGSQITAGCVRMHNADVEELFAIIPVGTPVVIVD